MNDLVPLDVLTPAIFTTNGIDPLIADIKKRVANFNADVSTPDGRAAIKSFAFSIAKSKTALDDLGKQCVADWKAKSKLVDAERSRVWDELEALQKEARKPLTNWEEAEENRKKALLILMESVKLPTTLPTTSKSASQLRANIESITIDSTFAELRESAQDIKEATLAALTAHIAVLTKQEEDAVELIKLREENENRKKLEEIERIKAEGAKQAAQEMQNKIAAEKIEAEKRELILKLEVEKAQREKLEAEQRTLAAAENERNKIAEEKRRAEAEETKRESDKKHKAAIHRMVIDAFKVAGLTNQQAEIALNTIYQGSVPNIKINY